MPRKQFEMVVATAPRETLGYLQISQSTVIPAGGNENIDFFAPAGFVGKIQSMYILVPPPVGATLGSHIITMQQTVPGGKLMQGESNFGDSLVWDLGFWYTATKQKFPVSDTAQSFNTKNALLDSEKGLRFTYLNYTNVAQTQIRNFFVTYIKSDATK